ncbi:MAG TPA: peptidoglycan-binding protein, partial [Candidatus Omnitrophota bacterium]|nr:peptidoglycan-binding protein [Candidatus Omnitrophota bacterium]
GDHQIGEMVSNTVNGVTTTYFWNTTAMTVTGTWTENGVPISRTWEYTVNAQGERVFGALVYEAYAVADYNGAIAYEYVYNEETGALSMRIGYSDTAMTDQVSSIVYDETGRMTSTEVYGVNGAVLSRNIYVWSADKQTATVTNWSADKVTGALEETGYSILTGFENEEFPNNARFERKYNLGETDRGQFYGIIEKTYKTDGNVFSQIRHECTSVDTEGNVVLGQINLRIGQFGFYDRDAQNARIEDAYFLQLPVTEPDTNGVEQFICRTTLDNAGSMTGYYLAEYGTTGNMTAIVEYNNADNEVARLNNSSNLSTAVFMDSDIFQDFFGDDAAPQQFSYNAIEYKMVPKKELKGLTPAVIGAVLGAAGWAIFGLPVAISFLAGLSGIFIPYLIYKYGFIYRYGFNPKKDAPALAAGETVKSLADKCKDILGFQRYKGANVAINVVTDKAVWESKKGASLYAFSEINDSQDDSTQGTATINVWVGMAKAPWSSLVFVLMHEKMEIMLASMPYRAPPVLREMFANIGEFVMTAGKFFSRSIDVMLNRPTDGKISRLENRLLNEVRENWMSEAWLAELKATSVKNGAYDAATYRDNLNRVIFLRRAGMPYEFLANANKADYYRGLLLNIGSGELAAKVNLLSRFNVPVKPRLLNLSLSTLERRAALMEANKVTIGEEERKMLSSMQSVEDRVAFIRSYAQAAEILFSMSNQELEKVNMTRLNGLIQVMYRFRIPIKVATLKANADEIASQMGFLEYLGLEVTEKNLKLSKEALWQKAVRQHTTTISRETATDKDVAELLRMLDKVVAAPDRFPEFFATVNALNIKSEDKALLTKAVTDLRLALDRTAGTPDALKTAMWNLNAQMNAISEKYGETNGKAVKTLEGFVSEFTSNEYEISMESAREKALAIREKLVDVIGSYRTADTDEAKNAARMAIGEMMLRLTDGDLSAYYEEFAETDPEAADRFQALIAKVAGGEEMKIVAVNYLNKIAESMADLAMGDMSSVRRAKLEAGAAKLDEMLKKEIKGALKYNTVSQVLREYREKAAEERSDMGLALDAVRYYAADMTVANRNMITNILAPIKDGYVYGEAMTNFKSNPDQYVLNLMGARPAYTPSPFKIDADATRKLLILDGRLEEFRNMYRALKVAFPDAQVFSEVLTSQGVLSGIRESFENIMAKISGGRSLEGRPSFAKVMFFVLAIALLLPATASAFVSSGTAGAVSHDINSMSSADIINAAEHGTITPNMMDMVQTVVNADNAPAHAATDMPSLHVTSPEAVVTPVQATHTVDFTNLDNAVQSIQGDDGYKTVVLDQDALIMAVKGGVFVTEKTHDGALVKAVQSGLEKVGISVGDKGADGVFGDDTGKAVREFQGKVGIKVDGIVGPETTTALLKAIIDNSQVAPAEAVKVPVAVEGAAAPAIAAPATVPQAVADVNAQYVDGLDDNFAPVFEKLMDRVEKEGMYVKIFSALRSDGTASNHTYGTAVDLELYKANGTKAESADYEKIGAIAEQEFGMRWGGHFPREAGMNDEAYKAYLAKEASHFDVPASQRADIFAAWGKTPAASVYKAQLAAVANEKISEKAEVVAAEQEVVKAEKEKAASAVEVAVDRSGKEYQVVIFKNGAKILLGDHNPLKPDTYDASQALWGDKVAAAVYDKEGKTATLNGKEYRVENVQMALVKGGEVSVVREYEDLYELHNKDGYRFFTVSQGADNAEVRTPVYLDQVKDGGMPAVASSEDFTPKVVSYTAQGTEGQCQIITGKHENPFIVVLRDGSYNPKKTRLENMKATDVNYDFSFPQGANVRYCKLDPKGREYDVDPRDTKGDLSAGVVYIDGVKYNLFHASMVAVNAADGTVDVALNDLSARQILAAFDGKVADAAGKEIYPFAGVSEEMPAGFKVALDLASESQKDGFTLMSKDGTRYEAGQLSFGRELGGEHLSVATRRGTKVIIDGSDIPSWTYKSPEGVVLPPSEWYLAVKAVDSNGNEWKIRRDVFMTMNTNGKITVINNIEDFVKDVADRSQIFVSSNMGGTEEISLSPIADAYNADLAYGKGSRVERVLNGYEVPNLGATVEYKKTTYNVAADGSWQPVSGRGETIKPENLKELAKLINKGAVIKDADGKEIYPSKQIRKMVGGLGDETSNAMLLILASSMEYRHKTALEKMNNMGENFDLATVLEVLNTSPNAIIWIIDQLSKGAANIDQVRNNFLKVVASVGGSWNFTTGEMAVTGPEISAVFTWNRAVPYQKQQAAVQGEQAGLALERMKIDAAVQFYAYYNTLIEYRHHLKNLTDQQETINKAIKSGTVEATSVLALQAKTLGSEIERTNGDIVELESNMRKLLFIDASAPFALPTEDISPDQFAAALRQAGMAAEGVSPLVFEQALNTEWAKHKESEASMGRVSAVSFGLKAGMRPGVFSPVLTINLRSGVEKRIDQLNAYTALMKSKIDYSATADILRQRRAEVAELLDLLKAYYGEMQEWQTLLEQSVADLTEMQAKSQVKYEDVQLQQDLLNSVKQATNRLGDVIKANEIEFQTALANLDSRIGSQAFPKVEMLDAQAALDAAEARFFSIGNGAQAKSIFNQISNLRQLSRTKPAVVIKQINLSASFTKNSWQQVSIGGQSEVDWLGNADYLAYLELSERIAQLELDNSEAELQYQFQTAYLDCFNAQESVKHWEGILAESQKSLDSAKVTKNLENDTRLRVESQVLMAATKLQESKMSLSAAKNNLERLSGMTFDSVSLESLAKVSVKTPDPLIRTQILELKKEQVDRLERMSFLGKSITIGAVATVTPSQVAGKQDVSLKMTSSDLVNPSRIFEAMKQAKTEEAVGEMLAQERTKVLESMKQSQIQFDKAKLILKAATTDYQAKYSRVIQLTVERMDPKTPQLIGTRNVDLFTAYTELLQANENVRAASYDYQMALRENLIYNNVGYLLGRLARVSGKTLNEIQAEIERLGIGEYFVQQVNITVGGKGDFTHTINMDDAQKIQAVQNVFNAIVGVTDQWNNLYAMAASGSATSISQVMNNITTMTNFFNSLTNLALTAGATFTQDESLQQASEVISTIGNVSVSALNAVSAGVSAINPQEYYSSNAQGEQGAFAGYESGKTPQNAALNQADAVRNFLATIITTGNNSDLNSLVSDANTAAGLVSNGQAILNNITTIRETMDALNAYCMPGTTVPTEETMLAIANGQLDPAVIQTMLNNEGNLSSLYVDTMSRAIDGVQTVRNILLNKLFDHLKEQSMREEDKMSFDFVASFGFNIDVKDMTAKVAAMSARVSAAEQKAVAAHLQDVTNIVDLGVRYEETKFRIELLEEEIPALEKDAELAAARGNVGGTVEKNRAFMMRELLSDRYQELAQLQEALRSYESALSSQMVKDGEFTHIKCVNDKGLVENIEITNLSPELFDQVWEAYKNAHPTLKEMQALLKADKIQYQTTGWAFQYLIPTLNVNVELSPAKGGTAQISWLLFDSQRSAKHTAAYLEKVKREQLVALAGENVTDYLYALDAKAQVTKKRMEAAFNEWSAARQHLANTRADSEKGIQAADELRNAINIELAARNAYLDAFTSYEKIVVDFVEQLSALGIETNMTVSPVELTKAPQAVAEEVKPTIAKAAPEVPAIQDIVQAKDVNSSVSALIKVLSNYGDMSVVLDKEMMPVSEWNNVFQFLMDVHGLTADEAVAHIKGMAARIPAIAANMDKLKDQTYFGRFFFSTLRMDKAGKISDPKTGLYPNLLTMLGMADYLQSMEGYFIHKTGLSAEDAKKQADAIFKTAVGMSGKLNTSDGFNWLNTTQENIDRAGINQNGNEIRQRRAAVKDVAEQYVGMELSIDNMRHWPVLDLFYTYMALSNLNMNEFQALLNILKTEVPVTEPGLTGKMTLDSILNQYGGDLYSAQDWPTEKLLRQPEAAFLNLLMTHKAELQKKGKALTSDEAAFLKHADEEIAREEKLVRAGLYMSRAINVAVAMTEGNNKGLSLESILAQGKQNHNLEGRVQLFEKILKYLKADTVRDSYTANTEVLFKAFFYIFAYGDTDIAVQDGKLYIHLNDKKYQMQHPAEEIGVGDTIVLDKDGNMVEVRKGCNIQDGKITSMGNLYKSLSYADFSGNIELPAAIKGDVPEYADGVISIASGSKCVTILTYDLTGAIDRTAYVFKNSSDVPFVSLFQKTEEKLYGTYGKVKDPYVSKVWINVCNLEGEVERSYGVVGTLAKEGYGIDPYVTPSAEEQKVQNRQYLNLPAGTNFLYEICEGFKYDNAHQLTALNSSVIDPVTKVVLQRHDMFTYDSQGHKTAQTSDVTVNNKKDHLSEFAFPVIEGTNDRSATETRIPYGMVEQKKDDGTVEIKEMPDQSKIETYLSIVHDFGQATEEWEAVSYDKKATGEFYRTEIKDGHHVPKEKVEIKTRPDGVEEKSTITWTNNDKGYPVEMTTVKETLKPEPVSTSTIKFMGHDAQTGRPVSAEEKTEVFQGTKPPIINLKTSNIAYDSLGTMVWKAIEEKKDDKVIYSANADGNTLKKVEAAQILVDNKVQTIDVTTVYAYGADGKVSGVNVFYGDAKEPSIVMEMTSGSLTKKTEIKGEGENKLVIETVYSYNDKGQQSGMTITSKRGGETPRVETIVFTAWNIIGRPTAGEKTVGERVETYHIRYVADKKSEDGFSDIWIMDSFTEAGNTYSAIVKETSTSPNIAEVLTWPAGSNMPVEEMYAWNGDYVVQQKGKYLLFEREGENFKTKKLVVFSAEGNYVIDQAKTKVLERYLAGSSAEGTFIFTIPLDEDGVLYKGFIDTLNIYGRPGAIVQNQKLKTISGAKIGEEKDVLAMTAETMPPITDFTVLENYNHVMEKGVHKVFITPVVGKDDVQKRYVGEVDPFTGDLVVYEAQTVDIAKSVSHRDFVYGYSADGERVYMVDLAGYEFKNGDTYDIKVGVVSGRDVKIEKIIKGTITIDASHKVSNLSEIGVIAEISYADGFIKTK